MLFDQAKRHLESWMSVKEVVDNPRYRSAEENPGTGRGGLPPVSVYVLESAPHDTLGERQRTGARQSRGIMAGSNVKNRLPGGFQKASPEAQGAERHTWGEWPFPCTTLLGEMGPAGRHSWGNACFFARHSRGEQASFHDILGAFFAPKCDILGEKWSKIHDTLGGKWPFSTTYSGGKWRKTSCSTQTRLPLDVDSSIFLLLLKQRKSSIKACSVWHATLHAPETPWRVNPGGTT